jgi:hypothetical protein
MESVSLGLLLIAVEMWSIITRCHACGTPFEVMSARGHGSAIKKAEHRVSDNRPLNLFPEKETPGLQIVLWESRFLI